MGAAPSGADGTVSENPPSTGVALRRILVMQMVSEGALWSYIVKTGPVTVMKAA